MSFSAVLNRLFSRPGWPGLILWIVGAVLFASVATAGEPAALMEEVERLEARVTTVLTDSNGEADESLAACGTSQTYVERVRNVRSDQGAKAQENRGSLELSQRRAGEKEPLAARLDSCHRLLEQDLLFARREALQAGAERPMRELENLLAQLQAGNAPLPRVSTVRRVQMVPVKGTAASDDCQAAPLIGLGSYAGTTTGATADGESTCGLGMAGDVWYRFVAPADGDFRFDLSQADFNAVMSIHRGSCPGTVDNMQACSPEDSGNGPSRSLNLQQGEDYFIRIAGFEVGERGNFNLHISRGAEISGQVRVGSNGQPLPGATVLVFRDGGSNSTARVLTDADGRYHFSRLQEGQYLVMVAPIDRLLGRVYPAVDCWTTSLRECSLDGATALELDITSSVADIDFELRQGGTIRGQVTDQDSGEPLAGVDVSVKFTSHLRARLVVTDEAGFYEAGGLISGLYFSNTFSFGDYSDEVWDNVPCAGNCSFLDGTPIDVVEGQVTEGIDFALRGPGGFAGTVTDAQSGEPASFVGVRVRGSSATAERTGLDGRYQVSGLSAGEYVVETVAGGRWIDELYDDVTCPTAGLGSCELDLATLVEVESSVTTEGIDFALQPGGRISGRVTDADSGEPLNQAGISFFNSEGVRVRNGITDSDGRYSLGGLTTGDYFVLAGRQSAFSMLWDGVPCAVTPDGQPCDPRTGTPVPVILNQEVTGIDLALPRRLRGSVAGRVTAADTGQPLTEAEVWMWRDDSLVDIRATDADGRFVFDGLEPGTYYFSARVGLGFVAELWEDAGVCLGAATCRPSVFGTPVVIEFGTQIDNLDFTLDRGGRVAGELFDAITGEPVPEGSVALLDAVGRFSGGFQAAFRPELGFAIDNVPAGTYYLIARGEHYRSEVYDDLPCQGGCDFLAGRPIEVTEGGLTAGLLIGLDRNPAIHGKIVDAESGQPLPARVFLRDAEGEVLFWIRTGSGGVYRFEVEPGSYRISTDADAPQYVDLLHNGAVCLETLCEPAIGDPIEVDLNDLVELDFELPIGGTIAGRMFDAERQPLSNSSNSSPAQVWDASGTFIGQARLFQGGSFQVSGLPAGDYFVGSNVGRGYVDEVWNDRPCTNGTCDPTMGDPVSVELGQTVGGIELALDRWGFLSGTVRDATSGVPISGASVWVFTGDGGLQIILSSDSQGRYVYQGSPLAYPLFLRIEADGYNTQLYDGLPCEPGSCEALSGTPLRPPLNGQLVADVELVSVDPPPPCVAGAETLCLLDGRFRVQVDWQRPSGITGRGQAVSLSADSGYFWFFGSSNVELVVKALDACGSQFDSFWLFAAGLTNVYTRITVTDMISGAEKVYENPLGRAFQPVLDTAAFRTCGAEPSSLVEIQQAEAEPDELLVTAGTDLTETALAKGGSCVASDTVLCLAGDRFAVEASWRRANGTSGAAQVEPLTGDTGYLWFFNAANLEVIVKLIDACGGSNPRFWVFAAGLTNLEVELKVTDTLRQETRIYRNEQGVDFAPIQDTAAFATCP